MLWMIFQSLGLYSRIPYDDEPVNDINRLLPLDAITVAHQCTTFSVSILGEKSKRSAAPYKTKLNTGFYTLLPSAIRS